MQTVTQQHAQQPCPTCGRAASRPKRFKRRLPIKIKDMTTEQLRDYRREMRARSAARIKALMLAGKLALEAQTQSAGCQPGGGNAGHNAAS